MMAQYIKIMSDWILQIGLNYKVAFGVAEQLELGIEDSFSCWFCRTTDIQWGYSKVRIRQQNQWWTYTRLFGSTSFSTFHLCFLFTSKEGLGFSLSYMIMADLQPTNVHSLLKMYRKHGSSTFHTLGFYGSI